MYCWRVLTILILTRLHITLGFTTCGNGYGFSPPHHSVQRVLHYEPSIRNVQTISFEKTKSPKKIATRLKDFYEDVGQRDDRMAWMGMVAYWITGALVGVNLDSLISSIFSSSLDIPTLTPWHLQAIAVTLVAQIVYLRSYGPFGRNQNWADALFAVANGIFETMWFVASHAVLRLPALIAMSASWMVLYEVTNSFVAVCAIHALVDLFCRRCDTLARSLLTN